MTEKKIKIAPAKGRPMLQWVGKKPLDYVKGFPAQLTEVFDPLNREQKIETASWDNLKDNWQNLLFHGDNKEIMATLLENGFRGKIDLIYIDPPFNTGVDYVRKVRLRNVKTEKMMGEDYSPQEQVMYLNSFADDTFLQFLYERLILLKELLSNKGIIFVRIDHHFGHYLKVMMDEIFGKDNFRNELVVNRVKKNVTTKGRRTIPHATDSVFVYGMGEMSNYYNIKKKLSKTKPGYWHAMESSGIPGPRYLTFGGVRYEPSPGTHFKFTQKRADEMYKDKKLRINPNTNRPQYWVEPKKEVTLDSNWTDIPGYTFTTDYPTENAEKLLKRVIKVASNENDIVLDCFLGSGTTAVVAQKLGRRWIGCDINKGAIQTTSKRLQKIILEEAKVENDNNKQKKLIGDEKKTPKYYSFAHYKVNDYDLQLLRTEAIELAAQHIGIQRKRTDSFFDGVLGKNLVKIIEFNHPLTLLDLQLLQDELKKRPDENRDITIVCLGKELAIDPWIGDYNKKHPINKFGVIELRTDKKYGRFLIHKAPEASVKIERNEDKAIVEIEEFISPAIIERLNYEEKLFKVKIPDFRSMIDVVLIDNDHAGKVFNIVYSDVPEKKNDLVEGRYDITIPEKKTTVAVKIIDMLGEEVLITKEV